MSARGMPEREDASESDDSKKRASARENVSEGEMSVRVMTARRERQRERVPA